MVEYSPISGQILNEPKMPDDPAIYDDVQMAKGLLNIEQFMSILRDIVNPIFLNDIPNWNTDGGFRIAEAKDIITETGGGFTTEIEGNVPIVTYDVFERVRSKSHKSLDPVLFNRFPDPNNPDLTVSLYRMWFDVEMDFKIFHTYNVDAIRTMDALENILSTYKQKFKEMGISDIIFLAEVKPFSLRKPSSGGVFIVRNLRYLVRIERILQSRSNNLNQVSTTIGTIGAESPMTSTVSGSDSFIDLYRSFNRPE